VHLTTYCKNKRKDKVETNLSLNLKILLKMRHNGYLYDFKFVNPGLKINFYVTVTVKFISIR